MRKSTPEDFWKKFKPSENGCLEWMFYRNEDGYGVINYQGQRYTAHRLAYLLTNGEIPSGMVVRHKCDNPACGNVDHLEVGTQKDNIDDRVNRGREGDRSGTRNGRAKLKDADVVKIREEFSKGGVTKVQLAKRYGVTDALIGFVIRKQAWKHL